MSHLFPSLFLEQMYLYYDIIPTLFLQPISPRCILANDHTFVPAAGIISFFCPFPYC